MSNLTDRAAYLRGLADGMGLTKDTNENKLLLEMLSLMDEMAQKINELDEDMGEMEAYVEDLDADLADIEDALFGDDDECDCCDYCGEDDEDVYEITCPNCGEVDYVSESELADEGLCCPKCGVKWEAEFEDEDGNPFELPDEE